MKTRGIIAGLHSISLFWIALISLTALSIEQTSAQPQIRHLPPSFIERGEETQLRFEIPDIADSDVIEAVLFFRTGENGSFSQQEMRFQSGVAETPVLITDPGSYSLEYYFVLRTITGRQYYYPDIIADEPPVSVEIVTPRIESFQKTDLVDVAIITPAANEVVSNSDFLLTAALFYDENFSGEVRLYMNGEDVTDRSEISPYLIKYRPDEMSPGEQTVQVIVDDGGTLFEAERWNFKVVRTAISNRDITFSNSGRSFNGDIELGAASQYIAGSANDQLTGRLNIRGQEGKLQYRGQGYLTTRESSRLQPQNRYYLDLRYGEHLFLEIGDTNPIFSNYSIRGRRTRGLYGGVTFRDDRIRVELLRGTLQRSISNRFEPIEPSDQNFGELYYLNLEENGRGAYKRILTGGRLQIGHRDNIRFSLNALRARDDTTSVNLYRNFLDVIQNDEELASSLSVQQRSYLAENPDDLQISTALPKPKENFTLGTEFEFTADNQRVRVHTEFAASLLNEDISGGVLDRERADELGIDLDGNIESLFNSLSWLIIINERMSTLPFKYRETENGTTEIDLFVPSSIFAGETQVDLSYGAHRIRADYRWVGPDFQSLANSTIRRDISGFTLSDRFRTLNNRLVFSGGLELLRDNVNNYRRSTTKTRTVRMSAGWYPLRNDLPRLNAGIRYRHRGNGIQRLNPFISEENLNASVRNFSISEDDTVSTATPRSENLIALHSSVSQKFSLINAQHEGGISFNFTNSKSDVYQYGDYKSNTLTLAIQSQFEGKPFQTRLAWNSTNSRALSGLNEANVRSIDLGVNRSMLERRLILNGTISFARSKFENTPLVVREGTLESNRDAIFEPDTESFEFTKTNTYRIRLRAEYALFDNSSVEGLFNYSSIDRRGSDFAALPNDRIIQLRYIHRF